MTLRVRRMRAADLGRVLAIAEGLAEAPRWPASAYSAAIDAENRPLRITLVAETGEPGIPAGFLTASLVPPEAELETIAVDAEAQRRGVGSLLLRALAEELGARQIATLNLEVRASNRAAIGLYRAQGFVEAGRRRRYYSDPEEDAVLMSLKLA
jgi:ribosomal-protein-alanine N-acetyltransferase